MVPRIVDVKASGYLYKWIYEVFEEDTETILWMIGDMLADFRTKRLFVL
jgi:hypothetical protein